MVTPGRSFSAGTQYRYGFNGKEDDKGISDGAVVFEARIYDNRLGRFLSTDPRQKEYTWQTPYAYFSNSPIWIVDFNGEGDKKNVQVSEKSVKDKVAKLEALKKDADVTGKAIVRYKKEIEALKSDYIETFATYAIADLHPVAWVGHMIADGIIGETELDIRAATIGIETHILGTLVENLKATEDAYETESKGLKSMLSNATSIKLDDGGSISKLSIGAAAAAIGINKNSKLAFGDWVFYEIKVEGETFKFGIADANRIRTGGAFTDVPFAGVPERTAQQLSAIFRKTGIMPTWSRTNLLQITKAKALEFESNTIKAFAEINGIPLGNTKEILQWAKDIKLYGMSAEIIEKLKPFLKIKL